MHLMEVPEGKGKESGRGRKACERVEYPSAMSTRSLSLSFVSVGVLKREWERDIRRREWICVVINGNMGESVHCGLYKLPTLPLVS